MKTLILNYLRTVQEGKTPTQIGMALGRRYGQASAAVSAPLKQLVAEGKVERTAVRGMVLYKYKKEQA